MRDKKTILYLLIISTFLLSMMALMAYAESSVKNSAKAFSLYSPDTDTFILSNNIDTKLPMASTTKIMTALIAIESLDLNESVTVPSEAVGIEGSSLYLEAGDVLTVKDLIYSLLLQSANDAAVVLALKTSGSIEAFANIMNERAHELGAKSTSFENPHGLDSDNHYTTAHDLALIAATAINNDTFRKIASTYKYSFKIGENLRTVVNHNKLLNMYEGCIGVKTGYTQRCGRCLVSAANKNGITLVAVTLSDPDDWRDHKNILDYGFEMLKSVETKILASIPDTIPAISANKDSLKIGLKDSDKYTVTYKSEGAPSVDLKLPPYIAKNVKCGDKIGTAIIKGKSFTKEIDVIALEDITIKTAKRSFFK